MIKIDNISKAYGSKVLFENFSAEIDSGIITVLWGKSGKGKTTLLNMIGGIEPFEKGEIKYPSFIVTSKKRIKQKELKNIGFIFQNFGLIDQESVKDNLMIVQVKDKEQKMKEALKTVGLEGIEKQKVCTLSGGEQQRVAIAKVLMKDCTLVLADEPTASLDAQNKELILSLLRVIADQGKSVVIVSHDATVKDVADQVIVL